MRRLLIVYHSRTGGARQMAQAAAAAARSEDGVVVALIEAQEAEADALIGSDAYIFAAPENLAALSGPMKDFFDRCYYPALDRLNGRAYAVLVCAGSDGTNAVRQIERIATGWRLKKAADAVVILTGAQTAEAIAAPKAIGRDDLTRCEEVGAALAAGLALGIY